MKKSLILFGIVLGILFIYLYSKQELRSIGTIIEKNTSFSVSKLKFIADDGRDIYALLFSPYQKKFDVVIVLPGAGGTKESRRMYSDILLEMGYGTLILDQRGIGETNGHVNTLQEDFEAYLTGKNIGQFLMAKDIVSAVNTLDSTGQVRYIAVLGESMGGRNAMIAAALEPRITTAIIISSAGYPIPAGKSDGDKFIYYINPNSYISKISPRRLLMLHAENDSVIPIDDAYYTFSLAREPKKFITFSEAECNHGYCEPMLPFLRDELAHAFQS